jgi:hypothetical protein
MLSVVMLSVVMLSVAMLSVVMLSVVILNVVVPLECRQKPFSHREEKAINKNDLVRSIKLFKVLINSVSK